MTECQAFSIDFAVRSAIIGASRIERERYNVVVVRMSPLHS